MRSTNRKASRLLEQIVLMKSWRRLPKIMETNQTKKRNSQVAGKLLNNKMVKMNTVFTRRIAMSYSGRTQISKWNHTNGINSFPSSTCRFCQTTSRRVTTRMTTVRMVRVKSRPMVMDRRKNRLLRLDKMVRLLPMSSNKGNQCLKKTIGSPCSILRTSTRSTKYNPRR